jgi:dihydroorotase
MKLLIKNGHIVDPANKIDGIYDILVEDTKIVKVASNIKATAEQHIEANGKIVIPGIVDMHVHLRQPGREDKETILSGTKAALKGAVTSMLAMPNTLICIDCVENLRLLKNLISASAQANVFITAAITKARQGKELTDIAALKREGAIAISDDGASIDSAGLMLEALKQAKKECLLITCHCEDRALSREGVVNLGFTSTRLGLRGISKESEYTRVKRDIELAEKANAPIHIAHISCAESVEVIAKAKKRGVQVTCETAPHYFALDEDAVLGYDTNRKMNPPLRSKDDVLAVKEGLRNGTIDAIASDHAPHTENEKEIEFDRAEFGTTGLETILAVSLTELFHTGLLGLPALLAKLTSNPAQILKIEKGTLSIGRDADLAIVSLDCERLVKKEDFVSKSKNSAFIGKKLKGVVEYTICAGKIAYAS